MTPVERLMCFVELWRNRSNVRGINASTDDNHLTQVYGSRGAVALTVDDIESVVAENVALRAQLVEERMARGGVIPGDATPIPTMTRHDVHVQAFEIDAKDSPDLLGALQRSLQAAKAAQ